MLSSASSWRLSVGVVSMTLAASGCGDTAPAGGAGGGSGAVSWVGASDPAARAAVAAAKARFRVQPDRRSRPGAGPSFEVERAVLEEGVVERFQRDGAWLRPEFAEGAREGRARVALPARARGAFELLELESGMRVEVTLEGARDVEAAAADGYLVYRGAEPSGGDVIHRPTPEGTEDFLLFESRPPAAEVVYGVELGEAVAGLRLVASTLELLDAEGTPRLRMAPPYLVDARGERHEATVALRGCDADRDPAAPWGREVTPAGASSCRVAVGWRDAAVEYPAILDPAWTSTANMATPRLYHGAVLFPSGTLAGRVLVIGGQDGNYLSSCELFNPAGAGTWAATGSLLAPRGEVSAALSGGQALVAGGYNGSLLATAERYNPASGTWAALPNMSKVRTAHTMTTLQNGTTVLVAGGYVGMVSMTPTAEVWNGAAWANVGSMTTGRAGHSAKLLQNGHVLAIGGSDGNSLLASVEDYDPVATTWTVKAPIPIARSNFDAVVLATGQVLAAGGADGPYPSKTADARIYTPGTNTWASAGTMAAARVDHTMSLLTDGKAVVVGTRQTGIHPAYAELYTPGVGWSSAGDVVTRRGDHTANVLLDGRVLVAGGVEQGGAVSATAEIYARLANGVACAVPGECTSGFCVDGVCCNSSCTATCNACTAALKGSGANGTCGAITAGSDPQDECTAQAQSTCGTTGACGGGSTCQLWASGTVCVTAPACFNSTTQYNNDTCNGSGTCVDYTTSACGAGYLCVGNACKVSCAGDADCVPTYFCNGGTCTADKANGQACNGPSQCQSGNCVDGVCCNTACTAQCQACTAAKKGSGANGTCGSIAVNTDPDNECATQAAATCGTTGFCSGGTTCQVYAQGTQCVPQSCAGATSINEPDTCNGFGTCTDSGTTPCQPGYTCSGSACLTSCSDDSQCTGPYYCLGSSCAPDDANGVACTQGTHCTSGFCVDGVCCDQACSGVCQACTAALKGAGVDGQCEGIVAGGDPQNECTTDAVSTCQKTGACSGASSCQLYAAGTVCNPTSCSSATAQYNADTCNGSGSCVDQGTTACQAAYQCVNGACQGSCSGDSDCGPSFYCSAGQCLPDLIDGAACATTSQCQSGFCVDGFCCDQACLGTCTACSAAKKGFGANGACGPIAADTDPENECQAAPPSSCANTGNCNGAGACKLHPAGTVCDASSCLDGVTQSDPDTCDGSGACVDGGSSPCQAGYKCVGNACLTSCTLDSDCAGPYFCNGGTCVPDAANGAACTAGPHCASGHCVDAVCCDSACGGLCQACTAGLKGAGGDGTCGPITANSDPQLECVDNGAASCQQTGACSGSGSCQLYAAGTVCTPKSCASPTSEFDADTCDGSGACIDQGTTDCLPGYACVGSVCKTTCAGDADCAGAFYCSAGTCVPDDPLGAPCSSASHCASAFCADGVCCDASCTTPCNACTAAKKGAGADGNCGPVPASTDPDNECPTDPGYPGSCASDGSCNGVGACRQYALAGTTCAGDVCSLGVLKTFACTGSGTTCAEASATPCEPYVCEDAQSCATTCASNAECVGATYCSGSQCQPKKPVGLSCGQGFECISGFCVDGFCCDGICSSICEACSGAKKGAGLDGACGPVKTGNDPDGDCDDDGAATCDQDGTCDGTGSCRLYPQGAPCGPSQCTGNLVKGQVCNGQGGCVLEAAGVPCAPYACIADQCAIPCADDTQCTMGNYCDQGTCTPKLGVGASCTGANQCGSSFCVDGVCCVSSCGADCYACTAVKKGTGLDGECGPIIDGTDPDDDCADDGAMSCQRNGQCNGSGGCKLYPTGSVCGAPACVGNEAKDRACDGFGNCELEPNGTDCLPYACSGGACPDTCAGNTDCEPSYYCDADACVPKLSDGTPCAAGGDCASGSCADGVCCDEPCTGQCEACDAAPDVGTCSPVAGAPQGDRPPCGGAGTACEGSCSGDPNETSTCTYPGATKVCGSSCTDATETTSKCDGNGACVAEEPISCPGGFACEGDVECKTSCAEDSDCTAGFACGDGGDCVPAATATCDGEHTVKNPNGSDTDCTPYRCEGTGCKQSCATVDDCVAPNVCNASNECVAADSQKSAGSEGGCGCSTPGSGGEGGRWIVALLAAAAGVARRRRRAARA